MKPVGVRQVWTSFVWVEDEGSVSGLWITDQKRLCVQLNERLKGSLARSVGNAPVWSG